jgi:hypothetical protein
LGIRSAYSKNPRPVSRADKPSLIEELTQLASPFCSLNSYSEWFQRFVATDPWFAAPQAQCIGDTPRSASIDPTGCDDSDVWTKANFFV